MDFNYTYQRKPVIQTWRCPRGCGYFRTYQLNNWWLNDRIDHPLYGRIPEDQLVTLDISGHDCTMYLEAHERITERNESHAKAA